MPATPNPVMNSKSFSRLPQQTIDASRILDAANDILYGLHQARVDRNYSTNMINSNNNSRSSEHERLLNTSPIRSDLKLSVSPCADPALRHMDSDVCFAQDEQKNFARDLFRTSTCLTRADKNQILAFIAGVRGR